MLGRQLGNLGKRSKFSECGIDIDYSIDVDDTYFLTAPRHVARGPIRVP